MTTHHVALVTADLTQGLMDTELEAMFAKIIEYMGCEVPVKKLAALDPVWKPVPYDEYDPQTFDDDVPPISHDMPVAEMDGFLFVYGDDGEQPFYWKYTKAPTPANPEPDSWDGTGKHPGMF